MKKRDSACRDLRTVPSWLAAVMLLAGCASVEQPAPDKRLLDFLQDGQTKREEIVLRLGPPARTMQGERILFYRLSHTHWGYILQEPSHERWAGVNQSLVLVLDEQGVLQKHSLVTVRKQEPRTTTP